MTEALIASSFVFFVWGSFATYAALRQSKILSLRDTEIERLKNVTKLHCDQIDTLQKEKKGWHNKNKLLNDTNDKLVRHNQSLGDRNDELKRKVCSLEMDLAKTMGVHFGVTTITKALDLIESNLRTTVDDLTFMGKDVPECITSALSIISSAYDESKESLSFKGEPE